MPSEDTDWAKRHATLLSLTEAKNLEALEEWLAPEATGPEGQSREALLAFGERWFARSEAIALSADVWTREKDAEGVTTRSRLRVGQQMLGFGSVFTVTLRWVEAPDAPMGWHILWADWVWEPPSNMSGSRS